jgi:hypothetical protein
VIFTLAAGVAAMHVFGHPVDRTEQMHGMAETRTAAIASAHVAHHVEPHLTRTDRMRAVGLPATDGMDPAAVCLAVLVTALLLPMLRRSTTRVSLSVRQLGAALSVTRA